MTLRRIPADAIAELLPTFDAAVAATTYKRLKSIPLGTMVVDDERGEEVFEWSEAVWRDLLRQQSAEQQRAGAELGLRLARSSGHLAMELYYTLRLGDLPAAEALVDRELRAFLLFTNLPATQALRSVGLDDLHSSPNLLLLLGELAVRQTGDGGRYHELALRALADASTLTPYQRYRCSCRLLFATVSLGDRAGAKALLEQIETLLWGPGGVLADVADPTIARSLAAELYLPFWGAIQIDDHAMAARLASQMSAHFDPASRTAIAEQITALTQAVFAGTDQPDGRDADGFGHTDPLLLIESGRDDEAGELIDMVTMPADTSPSRSAGEALVLLVRSMSAPRSLGPEHVARTIERSRRFWSDGRASSFIVLAATFAHLVRGDRAGAAALADDIADDWFGLVTTALLAVDRADGTAALAALSAARSRCQAPRANAVVGVLTALAFRHVDNHHSATATIESTGAATPPRLVRFALRSITDDDYEYLVGLHGLSTDTAAVLASAADDRRRQPQPTAPALTASERQTLSLIREGRTNPEIATARFVSVNTVRTQVRHLLRKLDVDSRRAAIAKAEQLGLFQD